MKAAARSLLALLLFLCISPLFSLNPGNELTQYLHDSWGLEDGLPQISVETVIQTRDGYLWMGTEEGLVRFDGQTFTVFDKSNTPGLKNNWILALYEDRSGVLWVGTDGGLLYREGGRFHNIPGERGLIASGIWAFCEDADGNLWIGTDRDGLFIYKNGKLSGNPVNGQLPGKRINAIYTDRQGHLWIGTDSGLYCVQNQSVTRYPHEKRLEKSTVNSILEDADGRLWAGTNNGLVCLANGEIHTYTTGNGLNDNRVRSLFGDKENNLWIGTAKGVQCIKNGKLHGSFYSQSHGPAWNPGVILPDHDVVDICKDHEGSLWLGTTIGGLHRFREARFNTYSRGDGLSNDTVYSIAPDRKGGMWIGTQSGLDRVEIGNTGLKPVKSYLPGTSIRGLHLDAKGNLWIGNEQGLNVMEYSGLTKSYAPVKTFLETGFFVRAIYIDRQENMWVGTDNGLFCLKDGVDVQFPGKEKFINLLVFAIHQDNRDQLWFGANSGLFCLRDGRLDEIAHKESDQSNIYFYHIHEEKDGDIWVGTGCGLWRIRNRSVSTITSRNGLFNDMIYQIMEDKNEFFWMSGNKGIFRVNKNEVEEFFAGKIKTVTCVSYNETDGMKSRECNGGSQPAGCQTGDGKLWFPTIKGAVAIDPGNLKNNPLPPPVVIESITAGKTNIPVTGTGGAMRAEIPPGIDRLEIHYAALSFAAPGRVRFRTRLIGYDAGWSDDTKRRTVDYTRLPPGNYTFRVKACNNDGIWNNDGAAVSIYIQPAFLQTPWFYALSIAAFLLLVISGVRFRERKLKNNQRKLQAMVKEQTRDLDERYHELASLEKVIKSINRETRLDLLLSSLLGEATALYPNVEKAFYCIYDHGKEAFKLMAVHGYPTGRMDEFSLTYDEAVKRYTEQGQQSGKGVYIIKDIETLWVDKEQPGLFTPRAMLVMEVTVSGRAEGFLVLENMNDPDAFDNVNHQLLSTFREHAVSAIARARIVEQLAEEKARAESASLSKSRFIANMSHEIRTPMNAILGFAEILRAEISDKSHRNMLQTVSSAGNTLLLLINNILDIARIEAGKIKLQPEPVSLTAVITEIKEIFSVSVREKDLDFIVDIPESLPPFLLIDELHIRQMLLNLVGNAVKFTGSGFVKLALREDRARCPVGHVDITITVEDTGIGIPGDQQDAIFEAFTQQKDQETAKYGGTGLGLTITSLIVRGMGGDITVRSRVGEGSVFKVSLPGVPISERLYAQDEETGIEIEPDTVRFSHSTVLVVDDSRHNRELIKQYLKHSDITFIEAGNGKDGLELADEYRPDVILMDVNMPVMGGIEATRTIKSGSHSRIPVILLSASLLKDEVKKYMTLSRCEAFLGKPFKKSELVALLMRFLPYTTVEGVTVEPGPADAEPLAGQPMPEPGPRLSELTGLLEDELLPLWEEVSKGFVISDKEDFALRVRQLGEQFEMPLLAAWGEQLAEHFQAFNLAEIERLWEDFPRLTGQISALARLPG